MTHQSGPGGLRALPHHLGRRGRLRARGSGRRRPGGITYLITQGGDQATIEERTPGLGLTATGVGTVTDQGAQFRFTAYNGSTGVATYVLQGPDTLTGVVTNTDLGTRTPVLLTHVG